MKRIILGCMLLAAGLSPAYGASTLETIKARGVVQCGVNSGVAGFSMPDQKGEWRGIDVDLCKGVAAAVLGDASKVKFLPYSAAQRFVALQSGEIDLLARNSTITFTRDTALGLNPVGVNFYDGQGFAVAKAANVKHVTELNGATVCIAQGTTHELNLAEYFRSRKLTFRPVTIEQQDEMYRAFFSGRCDAMTQDSSALAAAIATMAPKPDDYVILPELISKEPLGPFVRHGDDQWFDIVKWVLNIMVEAEEIGVTQANADAMLAGDNAAAQRLLGKNQGFAKGMGLEDAWAYNVIKAVGNYGDSFDRNLGPATPLRLARGLNDLWTRGGLLYAIPYR